MKVGELIRRLAKFDFDNEVVVWSLVDDFTSLGTHVWDQFDGRIAIEVEKKGTPEVGHIEQGSET